MSYRRSLHALQVALRSLDRYGWRQGPSDARHMRERGVCLGEALDVAGCRDNSRAAWEACWYILPGLLDARPGSILDAIVMWNDRRERTRAEVVDLLRAAESLLMSEHAAGGELDADRK